MRQTPVNDYLEEISTELPEELYGNLSDAIYWTVYEFDEEVAQLKDENAKLREQLEYALQTSRARLETIDRLKAENKELRKFAWDMYRCSDPCNDCPHYNGSNSGFYCGLGIGWKVRRMRELGIEVDG